MVDSKDYDTSFLFKDYGSEIKKQLLENFLLSDQDIDGDLFKSIVWLTEKDPDLGNKLCQDMEKTLSYHKKIAFVVGKGLQTREISQRTLLGHINIAAQDESWPVWNNVPLEPVIQLSLSDLPFIPKELEGIQYLCAYITPDCEVIIRTYTNESLVVMEKPASIDQERRSLLVEFEQTNDYPGDYQYPGVKAYLSYSHKDGYLVSALEKNGYNFENDFLSSEEDNSLSEYNLKILG